MKNKRFVITLSSCLKRSLSKASKHRNCSQAEVIRAALNIHLKEFIERDNRENKQLSLVDIFRSNSKEIEK